MVLSELESQTCSRQSMNLGALQVLVIEKQSRFAVRGEDRLTCSGNKAVKAKEESPVPLC